MPGRRYRRAGGDRGGRPIFALALALAVLVSAAPAWSITAGELPREAGTDVVRDDAGTLGLAVAGSVRANSVERLVTVTNNLGVGVTVTITVTNTNNHDLYVDGTNHGTQATFDLPDGDSRQVDVEAAAAENEVVFDVAATTTGVTVTANARRATVETGGGPPGGP